MDHGRRISVIGLGYVGLPVAVAFGRVGGADGAVGPVVAFDIDGDRIAELAGGHDRTGEVDAAELAAADLMLTTDPADLGQADFHIITVPTPIGAGNRPDLDPLLSAAQVVGRALSAGDIVVVESTVYPGATEEEVAPILAAESGLKPGHDFTLGYSPERINPGDRVHRFETITKVVAGQDDATLEVVAKVYGGVVEAGIHRAPDIRTAEAAKVIENTQRDLNIALMNELSLICGALDLDTHDVLRAAGTKWNFLPFTPGLVGGHCIGVDPYYLTHRAELAGYHPEVILAGRRINDGMGQHVARVVIKHLMQNGAVANGGPAVVTVLGVTFKADVADLRNSKALDVVGELKSFGADVQASDPLADPADAAAHGIDLAPLDELRPADAVVLAVPHAPYVEGGWPLIAGLLRNGAGLVADLYARLDRPAKPENIDLWRL